jgi:ABC-type uncharacterized transport system substrate-binding protein
MILLPCPLNFEGMPVRRRDVLVLLGGAVVTRPLAARAQQKPMPVIGYLSSGSPGPAASTVAAFRQGLGETGYVEGQSVAIDYRWAEGRYDRLPALAADLVDRNVDLIVAAAGNEAALAAKGATSAIPIVFTSVGDPVDGGLVASLARPGGNLTGFTILPTTDLTPKRLELLLELVPQARVIAYLVVSPNSLTIGDVQERARAIGVQLVIVKASSESEVDSAFASLVQLNASGLVVSAHRFFDSLGDQLVELASRHAVPAIYHRREFVAAGGLISYGPSFPTLYRRAGAYAGRILAGAKPADLPVEQPTKFELVINLKAATALGLAVPQSLLARADEVIE